MSPQRSNRSHLIEGTLRCLERLPPERITARAIAEESGANLASIAYHFGSKDNLVTEAVIEGLDRWLADIAAGLGRLDVDSPAERYRLAAGVIEASRVRHLGLARNFIGALAKAQHDTRVRDLLAAGFHRTRPAVAALLGLGSDQAGVDAAGLVLAQFNGLLFQTLLDPALAIDGADLTRAQARLRTVLPDPEPQIQRLLDELCGKLGFCLPPDEQRRLREHPPSDPDAFADAVFRAEGMDPRHHKQLRQQVLQVIDRHWQLNWTGDQPRVP